MKKGRSSFIGTIAVIVASIAYGIQPTFSSIIISMGVPETVLYMYLAAFSALVFAAIGIGVYHSLRISWKLLPQIAGIALCGNTLMEYFFAKSFQHTTVAMTELFHFTYPAIVIVLMIVLFRQKLTWIKISAVALAFAGVLLITDPGNSLSFAGCIYGVLSGVVYGIYIIANDRSQAAELPAPVLLFYVTLFSATYFVIWNLLSGTAMGFPSLKAGLLTAVISQTGSVLPIFTMAYGVRILGASRTVILNNIEPMVGVLFSTIVFHTPVTFRLILACICILTCSVLSGYIQDTK